MLRIIFETIICYIVTVAFGILFNVKRKQLIVSGFAGAIAWFVYKIVKVYFGFGNGMSFLIAGIAFATYSELSARAFKMPSTIPSACALIVLVPGYGVYLTMYNMLNRNYPNMMSYGLTTISTAGALALALVIVTSLFKSSRIPVKTEKALHKVSHIIKKK